MSTDPEPQQQPRINVRVPKGSDLRRRLDAAVEKPGMDEPTLILRCVEAAVEYIERHGEITLPLLITPRKSSARASATAVHGPNERESNYRSAPSIAEEPPAYPKLSKAEIAQAAKLARDVNKGRKQEAARSRSRKRAA